MSFDVGNVRVTMITFLSLVSASGGIIAHEILNTYGVENKWARFFALLFTVLGIIGAGASPRLMKSRVEVKTEELTEKLVEKAVDKELLKK